LRETDSVADAELLRLVQQGSKAALGALYHRYLPPVWRYVCTRAQGDRHTAEDVVSETFLAALAGLKNLDADGRSLYPWLIGIARHKLGDHRRQARSSRVQLESPGTDPPDPSVANDPQRQLETAENRSQAAQAMARLPDEERLLLEWKYVDELPVRAIAQRIGRTEKAVENLLYRARNSFRAVFRGLQGPGG
jgi:RNA polymerase sigma-70 factor (ECF subfamily)